MRIGIQVRIHKFYRIVQTICSLFDPFQHLFDSTFQSIQKIFLIREFITQNISIKSHNCHHIKQMHSQQKYKRRPTRIAKAERHFLVSLYEQHLKPFHCKV